MYSHAQFWKKFYLFITPFFILIVFRDAFIDFYFQQRAPTLEITFKYNLLVWTLWLAFAPIIYWLFHEILKVRRGKTVLMILLVIGSAVIHQMIHHWIFLSRITYMRVAWGSLMVSMFLGFVYAMKLQKDRSDAEAQATRIEKEIEDAKLLHVRTELKPDELVERLRRAKKTIRSDPEAADQQLADLADHLRATLKTIAGKLHSFEPRTVNRNPGRPRIVLWIVLFSASSMVLGVWITAARILDDVYVWKYISLPWDAYWNLWLSWFGVTLLTPLVFWLSRRFEPTKNFVIHFVACILFYCAVNIGLQLNGTSIGPWQTIPVNALSSGIVWGFKFDVYGAVLIAAVTLTRLESKLQEEIRVARTEVLLVSAQLQALNMQLQPHFLFNSLNSIIELIHQNQKQAEELITRLEQFFVMTLQVQYVQDVPLRKELEFVQCYLDMQKVRFPKRLNFAMNIDEKSINTRVPVLILQPLVENAIRHGIAQNISAGEIFIESKQDHQTLQLKVRDTGPGLTPKNIQEGIGFSNTRYRLIQMYGDQFRFEMQNEQTGGLVVSLEIPCRN
jgi:hypothetical protein